MRRTDGALSLEPAFGRSVLFGVLGGAALACALQGAGIARTLWRVDHPEAPGASLDALAFLVERPLVHLVVLPACFFLCYALTQVMGYRAELAHLDQGAVRPLDGVFLRLSGRNPHDATLSPAEYRIRQRRNDDRLFRPIDFGAGMLTMLGLLGTVIGLFFAMRGLPAVMENGGGTDRAAVLGELGFAFVTTIAGIAGSLSLSAIRLFLANMADRAAAMAEARP